MTYHVFKYSEFPDRFGDKSQRLLILITYIIYVILIAITSSTELVIWLNLIHAYILLYMLINSTLRLIGLS